MRPEGAHEGGPALHGAESTASAMLERAEVRRAVVVEFMLFEIAPDVFGRVEFGRIRRKLLDLDRAAERVEVLAHELGAMCGEPVPDDEQWLPDLLAERVQELDDLRPLDGAGEQTEVEAREGDAGDDGVSPPK